MSTRFVVRPANVTATECRPGRSGRSRTAPRTWPGASLRSLHRRRLPPGCALQTRACRSPSPQRSAICMAVARRARGRLGCSRTASRFAHDGVRTDALTVCGASSGVVNVAVNVRIGRSHLHGAARSSATVPAGSGTVATGSGPVEVDSTTVTVPPAGPVRRRPTHPRCAREASTAGGGACPNAGTAVARRAMTFTPRARRSMVDDCCKKVGARLPAQAGRRR
ncbi:MAG: hypothetical protein QOJ21_2326 [Solirubrobacteraceae bacterium]|nr:hypothetical protein [Solirubrobacteraceae bacterium]